LTRLLTIYFLSLPFIIVAGIILADYLAKPIVQIRDAANRISKGDFSINIAEIPHTRELAELAIDFNKMTENLRGLIVDLERRVEERTEAITRRTTQLRAASYIARQAAEVQDVSRLLERFVELVSDQFGYYHTGVYLINDAGDKITLRAASSEGGSRMMMDEKALRPGMQGLVNYVAETKKPKILADIGTDATIFNNPDLPLTRSEIAVPLLVRGRLLGILDIQSDKPSAFTTQDLDVFETLADQLAVAIDNAHLLEESQAALLQLEAVTTARTRDAWHQKLKEKPRVVTYTPLGLRAEKSGDVITGSSVGVPVLLRGQKIGTVTVTKKDLAPWNQPDQDLIEEVATQAGLAIENIRLLDEATTRAKQEQLVGGLAFRFSQALDIDSLLQTAARELGQIPGVEEATVVLTQSSESAAATSSPLRQPLRRTSS
jgi:GAF domain-containing protein